ncbi:hypothetical protein KBY93_09735 [Synechococcus sp. J7-Johnson]|uniref:hypothetical protein n=1 Tax=Synechococcus sp. J7-Johnson TaxID=2823737 RepID=UPI0020CD1FCD|nr:hypothetical protein [Synechococcus sp. J7-Johnson]MCP9840916.1 hypothetical protein [Synechococcus sp. J7-Johnson]
MELTDKAFLAFRSKIGQPRLPPHELIANDDQLKQMTSDDGLHFWVDGTATGLGTPPSAPLLQPDQVDTAHLWVIRDVDVVHAEERCAFGAVLESGVIKHTNLTGGNAAFSGGELVFLDVVTIVVNGCSGRYGPRSNSEMQEVARAFADSGYGVWSMGFDDETNRPARFLGTYPEWIA